MKHVAGEIEIREEPLLPCPKCGSQAGWTGPRYRMLTRTVCGNVMDELVYACRSCSYERSEPTKDALDVPPFPDPMPIILNAPSGRPWWRVWR